ncbi:metallophosphoesterase family protein [uncultured Flavonifractor sp.]|uniref:metallophosphoesterase family protein n=1 Tax=uncultured Flavonifractor sp. TaxID=1193534 RepID=UPI002603EE16|nr:metallophosphoesterase [uncultured Flavonifractor sp.]
MKILAVADVTAKYYFDFYTPGKLDDIDLILSCGDLHREYLEFLVTMSNRPVLYVHGNHDECYDRFPPEGCVCIDDTIYVHQGIRILGLGGSHRYRDGKYMYTEAQMRRRIRRLWLQLRKYGGFDILVTHAPARHINDFESISHRGFSCFVDLLEKYQPKYFLHGHIHQNYGIHIPQKTVYGGTTIINSYDHCEFVF